MACRSTRKRARRARPPSARGSAYLPKQTLRTQQARQSVSHCRIAASLPLAKAGKSGKKRPYRKIRARPAGRLEYVRVGIWFGYTFFAAVRRIRRQQEGTGAFEPHPLKGVKSYLQGYLQNGIVERLCRFALPFNGLPITALLQLPDEVPNDLYFLLAASAGFVRGMDNDFFTNSLAMEGVSSLMPTYLRIMTASCQNRLCPARRYQQRLALSWQTLSITTDKINYQKIKLKNFKHKSPHLTY